MQTSKKFAKIQIRSTLFILILLSCCIWDYHQAKAADDNLINIGPTRQQGLQPGMMIVLPDGRRTVIQELLPDGNFITDAGVILTPHGIITEGPLKGELIIPPSNIVLPEKPDLKAELPKSIQTPEIQTPEKGAIKKDEQAQKPEQPAANESRRPENAPAQQKVQVPAQEQELSIAELLPKTVLPGTQKAPETRKSPEKQQAREPEKKIPRQQEKKAAPKAQAPKKAVPGQALHIPPEAAKTGNLAFLEGCWQGTRPEYVSKRTIRECFCFGPNGKNGKRRVFDPIGKRMCIGATSASLSPDGVLSVTSSGAACNDGVRWGQAEMVCKNSGPSTPCSWVFRDAQNGRQSYKIPFVRVESCGR